MYPHSTWRLLNTGHLDGATNMAIDEAISRAVQANLVPPTLRFFGWNPACLSLGQAQPGGDVDRETCRAAGIDVVDVAGLTGSDVGQRQLADAPGDGLRALEVAQRQQQT